MLLRVTSVRRALKGNLLDHVIHTTLLPHQPCYLLSEIGKHNCKEDFMLFFVASVSSIE